MGGRLEPEREGLECEAEADLYFIGNGSPHVFEQRQAAP